MRSLFCRPIAWGIVSLAEYSAFPERSGYGKGQPFMDCPKNGKRLVVPFLFEWETLKLVSPDVFELLHVGQHLNVPVSRIIETGRDGAAYHHHLVGFHMAYNVVLNVFR